jgi:hypothetical protein
MQESGIVERFITPPLLVPSLLLALVLDFPMTRTTRRKKRGDQRQEDLKLET